MNKKKITICELGKIGEGIASDYLVNQQVKIIGRNIRTNYGEIDIIGEKNGVVIFFEVKTRRSEKFGYPEDAVNKRKQEHMVNSAMEYIQTHFDVEIAWRIDVIAVMIGKDDSINIDWFDNAIIS